MRRDRRGKERPVRLRTIWIGSIASILLCHFVVVQRFGPVNWRSHGSEPIALGSEVVGKRIFNPADVPEPVFVSQVYTALEAVSCWLLPVMREMGPFDSAVPLNKPIAAPRTAASASQTAS